MADILKPVDPEELKLIEQEPYEQRDLSVGRAVQFLILIFFTIIGSLIISYFVFFVGAAEPARRFAVGAPRSAPATTAPRTARTGLPDARLGEVHRRRDPKDHYLRDPRRDHRQGAHPRRACEGTNSQAGAVIDGRRLSLCAMNTDYGTYQEAGV
jgi:hypothetical protein